MSTNSSLRDTAREHKKDIINQVKKLGEMITLYRILAETEERINNNPWDRAYAKDYQISAYDMVLMVMCPMSEPRMRAYFKVWRKILGTKK